MYKTIKTMRQALAEARAYRDPVNEDRGFSTQQIKMAYGILNDPRYKQGNYSGAVKAIDTIAKGLSDHPDVANALKRANEELDKDDEKSVDGVVKQLKKAVKAHQGQVKSLTKDLKDEKDLEEAVFDSDAMQTIKLKNGAKVLDKIYTNRTQADNAASSLMKQHKGAEADAYQSPFNNKFYVRIKEDLEERFSKQDADKFDMAKYKENERNNQHGDNALLLVKKFGTAADYKKVVDIDIRHQKAGSISAADLKTRNDISNKHFGRLM